MKYVYYLKIASNNIKKKTIYIKLFFSYFIISFFLLVFLLNCFVIKDSKDNLLKLQSQNNKAQLIEENYSKLEYFDEEYVKETYVSTSITSGFSISKINIGEKEIIKKMFILGEMVDYNKIFPHTLIENYEKKNGEKVIVGNMPKENNQILINETMALNLGFNVNELIGKKLSMSFERIIGNLVSVDYIKNVEIAGIVRDNFIDVSEENYIFISKDIDTSCFPNKKMYNVKSVIIYFVDYKDITLRINEINEKYGVNFVATNSDAIEMYEKFETYGDVLVKIFFVFVILIFTGFFSLTLFLGYMEFCSNRKQYQVMYNYGLSKRSVYAIVFLQHLITYLLALVFSIVISTTLVFVFVNQIDNLTNELVLLSLTNLFLAYFITLICGFLLISIIVSIIIKFENKSS